MPTAREFKNTVFDQLARLGKAIASGPRLELLDLLCQGPRSVEDLSRHAGQSVANTSHHLQVLRRARLVETEKQGVHVTYRLAGDEVGEFFRAFRELADARLLEIRDVTRQFLEDRGVMEPVDRRALIERVRRGEVSVLDVRPAEEYRAGHIPGALSIPVGELTRRLAELPRDREIVAYCRGPYCVLSVEAVALLRASGYRALRMEDGVLDWQSLGFPVSREVNE
ncbi:metalloregulator ArsR/SmtB family transcription factor [bacterium]|nr:metalloregulator ArsR/SmtB family transcription factor [bacterium]